jgi:hypothetical protein
LGLGLPTSYLFVNLINVFAVADGSDVDRVGAGEVEEESVVAAAAAEAGSNELGTEGNS